MWGGGEGGGSNRNGGREKGRAVAWELRKGGVGGGGGGGRKIWCPIRAKKLLTTNCFVNILDDVDPHFWSFPFSVSKTLTNYLTVLFSSETLVISF